MLVRTSADGPEVLSKAKSALQDVSYEINDGDGGAEEDEDAPAGRGARGAVLEAKTRGEAGGASTAAEAARRAKQDELGAAKNAETLRRLTEQSARAQSKASASGQAADYNVYASAAEVPADRTHGAIVQARPRAAISFIRLPTPGPYLQPRWTARRTQCFSRYMALLFHST